MRCLKLAVLLISSILFAQKHSKYDTYFEKGNGNQTADYQEILRYYQLLDTDFESVKVLNMGFTDSGEPLQIAIFNADKDFNFDATSSKSIILINNGIHPGEPDGIDASMQFKKNLDF